MAQFVPLFQSVSRRKVVYIVNIEVVVRLSVIVQLYVQPRDEIYPSVNAADLAVSEKSLTWHFKVVLYDNTAEFLRKSRPHFLKPRVFAFEFFGNGFSVLADNGFFLDIARCCVNKHDFGLELVKFGRSENGVAPILSVFAFIKRGYYSAVAQKKFKYFYNIRGC